MREAVQQASGSTAQVQEGLQYLLSAACTPRSNDGAPAREPRMCSQIGVFPWPFGSSRHRHNEDAAMRRCGGKTCPLTSSLNWKRVPRRTCHNTLTPALHSRSHHYAIG